MTRLSRRLFLTGAGSMLTAAALAQDSKSRARATRSFSRERFIEDVKRALPEGQQAVDEVIARAVSDPSAVLQDLGEPSSAAIELLHKENDLSIFNIVWPPYAVIGPHDHLMWASIGVYTGREDNIMWRRDGDSITSDKAASIAAKDVFALPADGIHSVYNPISSYTGAIHVYGGDLPSVSRSQWDPLTLDREPFDLEEGRRILEMFDRRA